MATRKKKEPTPPPTDDELCRQVIDNHIAKLQQAKEVSIRFRLWGEVVPKARPRGTSSGRFYMPENYVNWKQQAIRELESIKKLYPQYDFPLLTCSALYILDGRHNRQGDGDNIAGSINDAMVNAADNTKERRDERKRALGDALEYSGIFKQDNLISIPDQSIILNYDKKRPPSTLIVLY